MPTGASLRLPAPPGVLLTDPLASDAGGLLPESKNVITRFGSIQSRPGITQLGQTLNAGEPHLGAYWTRAQDGTIQLLSATDRRWWHFNNTTRLWEDLSGGVLLTGSTLTPVTFQYWEEGNNQFILGVNDTDAAKEWQVGAGAYADVATGYIAKTVCAVANRVFYGNVTIGGVRFPTMCAWSAAGTRGTNPALARNKLIDTGDHIVAVRRIHRLSAAVYRERSIWIATAVQGSDARAFSFDVADQKPGPCGPMAVGEDVGFRHIYFGTDLNLWGFDGTQASLLAATSDILKGRFNPVAQSLVSVAYDPIAHEVWVSLPLDGDTVPTWTLIYSLMTQGVFLGKLNMAYPVSMLASWQVELDTPTHLLPDVPTHLLPDIPTHQLGFVTGQETLLVGTSDSVWLLNGPTDNNLAIDLEARVLMPTAPGMDHVFDGVEIMAAKPGAPITVSVLVGPTYDNLTEIPLGIIDPSITPPTTGPVDYTPGGPNLSVLRATDEIRGRIAVVRFVSSASQSLKVRRIELTNYDRRMAA